MATMAINNDISRWGMVAPPLPLGGHTVTMSLSHRCSCVTWQYTNCVCHHPNPQNHLQMVHYQDLSECHSRAQFYGITTKHIMITVFNDVWSSMHAEMRITVQLHKHGVWHVQKVYQIKLEEVPCVILRCC